MARRYHPRVKNMAEEVFSAAASGSAWRPLVSVVVPVRNEDANVLPLIREIQTALAGLSYEIIYVDDGSTDGTPMRLAQAVAETAPLRFFRHRESCGQSASVVTGVREARGTWIATLDGDGQNDPNDIPGMLARAQAEEAMGGQALVAGWRQKRRDTASKRLASRFANRIRSAILRDATPDTGCGLKVFRKEAFMEIPHFDHMHRYLPALFIRSGRRVVSVPVNHRHRMEGKSNYNNLQRLMVGIIDLAGMYWLQRRWNVATMVDPSSSVHGAQLDQPPASTRLAGEVMA
jgi:dolichol-phosphate mannosyltransferase